MSATHELMGGIASALFEGASWPTITQWHMALFLFMPDELVDYAGVEVSHASYSRAQLDPSGTNWDVIQDGFTKVYMAYNLVNITFPVPTGTWGDIVGWGLYDQSNNLRFSAEIPVRFVGSGSDAPDFEPGAVEIHFGEAA